MVKSIISRYAPPNENQTIAYIQSVCKQLNVHSTETIDVEERGILCILIKAIIRMENGCQSYSDETIIKGINLSTVSRCLPCIIFLSFISLAALSNA